MSACVGHGERGCIRRNLDNDVPTYCIESGFRCTTIARFRPVQFHIAGMQPLQAVCGVGSGYWLYLPVFGWFSPSRNCVESLGVPPDVEVDIDPHRLAFGDDCQLTKAIDHLR
jgi:hypothetical protein